MSGQSGSPTQWGIQLPRLCQRHSSTSGPGKKYHIYVNTTTIKEVRDNAVTLIHSNKLKSFILRLTNLVLNMHTMKMWNHRIYNFIKVVWRFSEEYLWINHFEALLDPLNIVFIFRTNPIITTRINCQRKTPYVEVLHLYKMSYLIIVVILFKFVNRMC